MACTRHRHLRRSSLSLSTARSLIGLVAFTACSGEQGGEGTPSDMEGASDTPSDVVPTPDEDDDGSSPSDPSDPGLNDDATTEPSDPENAPTTDPANPAADAPGVTDPDDPASPAQPVDCETGTLFTGSAPMRRLSSTEYLNTLEDLFPSLRPELPTLPVEDPVDSFENDALALGPSDIHVSRWEEIAFRYASEVSSDPTRLAAFLPCTEGVSDAESASACGAELIDAFGLQTHRRPLTEDEQSRYQTLFDEQLAAIDFEAAVQLTAMAMLESPWFLYRLETASASEGGGVVPLDSWEMASRLSYYLWQRMPDEELFDAAAQGVLLEAADIEQQARRMLSDPRARAAVADFHRQWLFFDRIQREEHAGRLPELFPDWDAQVQASAHEELLRFVSRTIFDGGGRFSDLLLSREADVDAALAGIYGVEVPDDGQWSLVTLPEAERAGILTRVGFLAAHAHSANGSPPLRGNYVMQRLFCIEMAPPPPDADTSPPEAPEGMALTNRELFEERAAPDACRACHTILHGFGLGFEHYDAVGAYRETDNGVPVDATATLIGTDIEGEIDGAIELSQRMVESARVAECVVSRWYRYARGRAVEAADQCALDQLEAGFAQSGGSLIELMVDIATSPEFRHRPFEEE